VIVCASAESHCNDKRSDCFAKAAVKDWCLNPQAAVTCPFSCGYCGEGRPVNQTGCKDVDVHCAWWAQSGECDTNPEMMRRTCPTSCSMCTPECPADQMLCPAWAEFGECDSNPQFAVTTCPVTCGACKSMCKDKNEHCANWAEVGECTSNPAAMTKECPMSCGVCADSESGGGFAYCHEANSTLCKERVKEGSCTDDVTLMLECPQACELCSHVCMDHDPKCSAWVKEEKCVSERAMMLQKCPAACGLCHALELEYNDEPCVDDEECPGWARAGQCNDNRPFMIAKCPIACGICYEPGHPNLEVAKELKEKKEKDEL